jgi:hypothetical protein
MLRKRLNLARLIAALALVASLLKAETLGKGTVKSPSGAPLGQVWVQELGTWKGSLTKTDGAFMFPLGKPTTLLLTKDDFRPEIISTTGAGTDPELGVVLHPEPNTANLRCCMRQRHGLLPEFELGKTSQVEVKHDGGADFVAYTASITTTGEVLKSVTGLHVAGLTPTPDWAKGLSSLTVRSIKCGGVQWIDLRGVSDDGLGSRWIGWGASQLEYSKVSKKAALLFDRAIDKGCCRKP